MNKKINDLLFRLVKENAITNEEFEMLIRSIYGESSATEDGQPIRVSYHLTSSKACQPNYCSTITAFTPSPLPLHLKGHRSDDNRVKIEE